MEVHHKTLYPVARITPQGTRFLGTCFVLDKPGHFATALHVTDQLDQGLIIVIPGLDGYDDYQRGLKETYSYVSVEIIAADPVRDLCVLKATNDTDIVTNIKCAGTDSVSVREEIAIIGFPHLTDNRIILTYQETIVGAKTMLTAANIDVKHIIANLQTSPGQSGSPVFRKSNADLIGIVAGAYNSPQGSFSMGNINPGALNQTTMVVSAEYLSKMY